MAISTGAALLGAAGIGAVSSLIGGKKQESGGEQAIQTQAATAGQATESQERMFDQMLAMQQPYMQAGQTALPFLQSQVGAPMDPASRQLLSKLGTMRMPTRQLQLPGYQAPEAFQAPEFRVDMEESPIYKWRLAQEQEQLDKTLAQMGMVGSGARIERRGDIVGRLGAEESERAYQRARERYAREYGAEAEKYGRGLQQAEGGYGRGVQQALQQRQSEETDYARRYGQLSDLFNIRQGLEQGKYSQALNLANIGRGAATAAGGGALQTGAGIAGTQRQAGAGIAGLQQLGGQQQAQMYGSLGALPMQGLQAYQQSQFLNRYNPYSFNSPASAQTGFYGPTR
jgi:hypothetical protein